MPGDTIVNEGAAAPSLLPRNMEGSSQKKPFLFYFKWDSQRRYLWRYRASEAAPHGCIIL